MSIMRTTHFTVTPEQAEAMIDRRATLIAAVRRDYPGLAETRLSRIDSERWVDVWRWDSAEVMQAALAAAPNLPEAAAAFALTSNLSAEQAELVDER